MTTSGPRSGKFGFVNGAIQVRNWSLNWNEALADRVHSASMGGHERISGVEDWNGSFEGFGGWPGANLFPGNSFSMLLFAGPDDGVYGNTGKVWVGTAIIESLTINWNWLPSNSINWSIAFAANGCLADADNEYYDSSEVCVASMCDLYVEVSEYCTTTGTGGYSTLANLESATLTFTSANQPVVNSSTSCCTQRRPGILDWTFSFVDQEQHVVLNYATPYVFRAWTSSLKYWELAFGLMQDVTDIRVDVESGAINTKTNNFAMSGRVCCDEQSYQAGWIIDPEGNSVWPVAAV